MNKRLLFITHHKLDENNGGSNASKGFIHCFASLFEECAIICPKIHSTTPYLPQNVEYYPLHDTRSKVRKFFDMYRGRISGIYYAVKEHLKENKYDIVVIDHSFSGAGLSKYIKSTGSQLITIHHNVERDYLRDNGKERPLFYRHAFLHYSKKSERDCLKNSDVNLTVTKRDASIFSTWYPNIKVYPWGIFEYRPLPDKTFVNKGKKHTFIITGSLYFAQSLLPIMDFVDKYWPLVREQYPNATLLIAGRNPSEELKRKCGVTEGITLIPNPEDINEVVQRADYYICPIFAGSGLKLRIYDGLKQGLPVLCHEVSAAGYEEIEYKHCLFTYRDKNSFSTSLRSMLSTVVSQEDVYNTYRKAFSLETGIKKLQEIIEKENI